MDITTALPLGIAPALIVLILVIVAAYRLYLHPLADVPGPKICALTGLYELWWDCVMVGQFFKRVQRMHDRYGPIVRIGPNEVHIRDPEYYEIVYSSNTNIEKEPWFYRFSPTRYSTFSTLQGSLHRLRRSAIRKSFSPGAMDQLEPPLRGKVRKLFRRLDESREAGEEINLGIAFRAFTMDVISSHALPQSREYLDQPDMGKSILRSHTSATTLLNWRWHTPWSIPLISRRPKPLSPIWDLEALENDDLHDHFRVHFFPNPPPLLCDADAPRCTKRLKIEAENAMRTTKQYDDPTASIAEVVRTSPLLDEDERSFNRVLSEAGGLLGAGVDSPANIMNCFVFHVLSSPRVFEKLRAELQTVPGNKNYSGDMGCKDNLDDAHLSALASSSASFDIVPTRALLDLEYLQAAIREALRMKPAALSRLPRVNRSAAMTAAPCFFQSNTFPPGTSISMNIADCLADPTAFPEPDEFRPERWLEAPASSEQRARMDKAFVPFSKGARNCIGQEMARRELTIVLGNLFRTFDMELCEGVSARDISGAHDFFGPLPPRDSKGLRVRVKALY